MRIRNAYGRRNATSGERGGVKRRFKRGQGGEGIYTILGRFKKSRMLEGC